MLIRSKIDLWTNCILYQKNNEEYKNGSIDQRMKYLKDLIYLRSKVIVTDDFNEYECALTYNIANLLLEENYEQIQKMKIKIDENK